jgi:hypothetical protein
MSADKSKAKGRRLQMLKTAALKPLFIDCRGGIAKDDPNLRHLLDEGHLKITHVNKPKTIRKESARHRFHHELRSLFSRPQRTRAVITESGMKLLEESTEQV